MSSGAFGIDERLLSRVLRSAHRHRAVVLAGAAVLALIAVPLLLRLSFDSNVLNLLPQRGPAVRSFQTYLRGFGSLDRLYIVFEVPSNQSVSGHADFVQRYVDELRQAPEIQHVDAGPADAGKDWGYVFDHELLLLGAGRVSEVLARFEPAAVERELAQTRETLTLPSADIKALVRQDPLGLLPLLRERLRVEATALNIDPSQEGYVTPDGRSRLIIVKPVRPPYDTAFCRQLMQRLDSIETRVRTAARDPVSYESDPTVLIIERVGAYRASLETENLIRHEGSSNSLGSLAGVLLLVYIVFRSLRVLLSGAIPLLLAAALTAALNGLWWQLSTAASGSAAMLFGVGIDGVLLLYVRYLEERGKGLGAEAAIGNLSATTVSMMMGFTTTAATYFALMLIDFPSLEEVGRLIGTAILISGFLTIAIVPALLPRKLSSRQARPLAIEWLGRIVLSFRRPIIWTAIAATVVLGVAAPGLRVVPTLQKLQPQTAATRAERELFRRFSIPEEVVLVLAEGPDLEALLEANGAVVDHLRERTPNVLVTSPVSFIPTRADQDEVRRVIRESGISAANVSERFVRAAAQAGFRPDAFAPFLDRLPRLLDADRHLTYEGYAERGLTDLIGRYVTVTPNGYMTVAYAYPDTPDAYRRFEEAVRASGQPVQITGVSLVNEELSRTFAPQFVKGGLIGTVAVAILIFLGFGSIRYTILSLLPTALGLLWCAGALALMKVELDLFSAFALLMCIGIGVDYSIHVLHRHAMEPTRSITEPLAKVAPAILLAWATTVIGFGTLVTSSYAPLRSLGLVSAVSVTACLLTSLLVLPALLLSFGQPKTDVATHVDLPRSPQRSDAPMSVCVVIAAYNEAATVAKVVAGAKRYVPGVFVVDDGSTDATAQQAEGAGAVVLRHQQNQGKGRAVCTGLARVLALDYTHVLLMDADLQHDPDDIPALLERAHLGVGDLVLGERPFSRETMPASRFYTNTISSRVISRFFIGTQVSDAQSGFRLIRTSLLEGIRLTGRGYEIETEMLIKLARKGARIERTTVQLRYEEARSKLRPIRDTTRTCFLAVRYRFFPERWA